MTCVKQVMQWCKNDGSPRFERIEFVFEDGDLGKGNLISRFRNDLKMIPSFKPKQDKETPHGRVCGFTPLQAADFFAYEVFLGCKNMDERKHDPRWPLVELFGMMGELEIIEAENLQTLDMNHRVARETADRFRRVYGRYKVMVRQGVDMEGNIIQRFRAALPQVRSWIDEILNEHAEQARTVGTLGFKRLSTCFPQKLLERAKVVTVSRVPFPPVERFGLPELAAMQQILFAGITFKDTFFVQQGQASESLHFHELVHVVQWARLGVDNFLFAYGVGLVQSGYEQSPLEQMALALQRDFENGKSPQGLVNIIETRTDAIWTQVAALLQGSRL